MRIRRMVAQLLLLAVLFNALVGMPLHAASHLASPQSAALQLDAEAVEHALQDDVQHHDEHHRELHALCEVCAAYAQQGHVLTSFASIAVAAGFTAARIQAPTDIFVPETRSWVCIARGPPASAI